MVNKLFENYWTATELKAQLISARKSLTKQKKMSPTEWKRVYSGSVLTRSQSINNLIHMIKTNIRAIKNKKSNPSKYRKK